MKWFMKRTDGSWIEIKESEIPDYLSYGCVLMGEDSLRKLLGEENFNKFVRYVNK